jgi:homoserine kinase
VTDGWPVGPVTVRVPATSANLGPGFDSFGLALTLHDTVTARVIPDGVTIEMTGEGAATAPSGEQHLVVRAMRAAFDHLRRQPPGLALCCRNEIPQGFGLGSSAGAVIAGLLAARALAGPAALAALPDPGLLALATRLEGHPDNVAACLAGALTIAWTPAPAPRRAPAGGASPAPAAAMSRGLAGGPSCDAAAGPAPDPGDPASCPAGSASDPARALGPRVARLVPLPDIAPVLCVPATPLPTVTARQVLPAQVPHADAAAN